MRLGMSFGWPFRGRWLRRWLTGIALVLLLPIGFVPLLGYAVACTRAAAAGAAEPPSWRQLNRILPDGLAVAVAIAIVTLPFALLTAALVPLLSNPGLWRSEDPLLHVEAWSTAILIVALPWGFALLLLMPHATARYAASGRALDLLDVGASLRAVRTDFSAWNLSVAAIVTVWALGLACAALFCVGLAPGVFYAILVSAHAASALQTGHSPRRPAGANTSAR